MRAVPSRIIREMIRTGEHVTQPLQDPFDSDFRRIMSDGTVPGIGAGPATGQMAPPPESRAIYSFL
jgi:hypothetical protein